MAKMLREIKGLKKACHYGMVQIGRSKRRTHRWFFTNCTQAEKMNTPILVVDDDRDYLALTRGKLMRAGFSNLHLEDDPAKAAALFKAKAVFDVALIDVHMPGMDGFELLERIKTASPETECIMLTAVNDARTAVACLRKGAYDYLVKPVSQEDLVLALKRTLERKRLLDILDIGKGRSAPALKHPAAFEDIVTRAPGLLRVLQEAELHAASDVPVLITGESGSGKELLARAIHRASPRAAGPFTPVNMASLSVSLFEAEFFGHTRGAFTGAEKERAGFLKHTHGGSLFLDEIGNLPLELQGKLLRVLQDGEYTRLGASRTQRVDVRLVAATNEDLESMMAAGTFRKDLFYRIRGSWLHLPPLRERTEDIPLLVDHFLAQYGVAPPQRTVDEEAMCLLMEYPFPGNVRELRAVIQSAVNLADGRPLTAEFLPAQLRRQAAVTFCRSRIGSDEIAPLAEVEKKHILNVYRQSARNKTQTARLLGIGLNTLRRKLKTYGET